MHIKKFYPKDERFFRVLATSGNIRSTDAHKIDISDTSVTLSEFMLWVLALFGFSEWK